MNASFSPEVVGIIRNKILATIEKVLSIKFPFIRDLGIGTLQKNGSKNAALGHKNAALGPFGLRPRFITRPKACDYRPGRSKAALFEPRPKTRSYSRGKNATSDRPGLSTIWT